MQIHNKLRDESERTLPSALMSFQSWEKPSECMNANTHALQSLAHWQLKNLTEHCKLKTYISLSAKIPSHSKIYMKIKLKTDECLPVRNYLLSTYQAFKKRRTTRGKERMVTLCNWRCWVDTKKITQKLYSKKRKSAGEPRVNQDRKFSFPNQWT